MTPAKIPPGEGGGIFSKNVGTLLIFGKEVIEKGAITEF
jgi:hypothetical protein